MKASPLIFKTTLLHLGIDKGFAFKLFVKFTGPGLAAEYLHNYLQVYEMQQGRKRKHKYWHHTEHNVETLMSTSIL